MPQTVIFGASRQGHVVLEILRAVERSQGASLEIAGFLDDDPSRHGTEVGGAPVLGGSAWALARPGASLAAFVAIGNNDARMTVADRLRAHGVTLINAIHPAAVMMGGVTLGTGVLVAAGAVIVTGTRVEDDAVINTGATVDHDSLIGRGAYIAPGVHTAGCVTIGRGAFIGAGATIGPGVTLGEGCIIGAGSLVLADAPPRTLAFGSPARVVKTLDGPPDWRRILAGR